MTQFEKINKGFNNIFQFGKLSLGLVIPLENYAHSPIPTMKRHLERVKLVEDLNFKAIWLRDVPFHVPSFGDAGQIFDPFTYLGFLVGQTKHITLGTASIALPLRHPVHVAKSATTIDQFSNGRLVLGVASGDRPNEYPAMGIPFDKRSELFREAFGFIRDTQKNFPVIETKNFGKTTGQIDVLPKASQRKIPMMVTGYSQQSLEWNAMHGDGWISYPKNLIQQEKSIQKWRDLIPESQAYTKPFLQPLYIDLKENPDYKPEGIHLGFRIGSNYLIEYFKRLENIGVNHIALNLRFNSLGTEKTLDILAEKVLPNFNLS